jgi:hypothetical protein
MAEYYKTVTGFPNYKISNYGNIKNEKKILKQTIIQGGYSSIKLNNETEKNKKKLIHVLVAQTFIPNPENKPTVNHKDHNKLNNTLDNLEWATSREQNIHKRQSKNGMCGARPVWRIDKNTNEKLEKYISITKALEWLLKNVQNIKNKKGSAHISDVCNNKKGRPTAYGYKWCYADIEEYIDEEWKDIPPQYINNTLHCKVSNYGRFMYKTNQITSGYKNNEYLNVSLNSKVYKLHRLVAFAFIQNPENKPVVNHIDGNKTNNNVKNLEWNTHKENATHAQKTGLCKDNKNKIVQLDLNGNVIALFGSQIEASKKLNINISTIRNCCNEKNKAKTAGGFIFKYYNESGIYDIKYNTTLPSNMNGQKGVVQYDKDMNKIKEFKSIKEASNELNLSYFSIGKCCNGKQKLCGDFIFKFT